MRNDFIDKVNDCDLEFCVNLEASGIDNEDGSLSADDFDHVDYYIKNGKLFSWCGKEIMDLSDLEDSWWERAMHPNEDYDTMTLFDCFITELMNHIIQNDLIGSSEFNNLMDDERKLLVILRHPQYDVIEEIDEWDILAHFD